MLTMGRMKIKRQFPIIFMQSNFHQTLKTRELKKKRGEYQVYVYCSRVGNRGFWGKSERLFQISISEHFVVIYSEKTTLASTQFERISENVILNTISKKSSSNIRESNTLFYQKEKSPISDSTAEVHNRSCKLPNGIEQPLVENLILK